MRPDALGISDVGVQTREKVKAAQETLDAALQYALDEITRVGAIQNRL